MAGDSLNVSGTVSSRVCCRTSASELANSRSIARGASSSRSTLGFPRERPRTRPSSTASCIAADPSPDNPAARCNTRATCGSSRRAPTVSASGPNTAAEPGVSDFSASSLSRSASAVFATELTIAADDQRSSPCWIANRANASSARRSRVSPSVSAACSRTRGSESSVSFKTSSSSGRSPSSQRSASCSACSRTPKLSSASAGRTSSDVRIPNPSSVYSACSRACGVAPWRANSVSGWRAALSPRSSKSR